MVRTYRSFHRHSACCGRLFYWLNIALFTDTLRIPGPVGGCLPAAVSQHVDYDNKYCKSDVGSDAYSGLVLKNFMQHSVKPASACLKAATDQLIRISVVSLSAPSCSKCYFSGFTVTKVNNFGMRIIKFTQNWMNSQLVKISQKCQSATVLIIKIIISAASLSFISLQIKYFGVLDNWSDKTRNLETSLWVLVCVGGILMMMMMMRIIVSCSSNSTNIKTKYWLLTAIFNISFLTSIWSCND